MESLLLEKKGEELEFSYEIIWQHGFDRLAETLSRIGLPFRKICIVTDDNVAPLYLEQVRLALAQLDAQVFTFILPAGEEHKNLASVSTIYEYLIRNRFERKDLLLALGGGVVGDMTGFTAATYLRGIDFIQVPTTLLAQVDSSVGGKTGVDFDAYKNMVGAFYQPRLVYMNTDTLKTLPAEQFSSGMAEVIKSALIRSQTFFRWIEASTEKILSMDPDALDHMVHACCEIKASVVAEDPKENGVRAILNFGHTIGHAVEKLKNFTMLHGQCVGYGMACAAALSRSRGLITAEEEQRILDLNRVFALPNRVADLSSEEILQTTKSDKKMEAGKIKFILLRTIGEAFVDRSVTDPEVRSAVLL